MVFALTFPGSMVFADEYEWMRDHEMGIVETACFDGFSTAARLDGSFGDVLQIISSHDMMIRSVTAGRQRLG